jgi:hypothetical protein
MKAFISSYIYNGQHAHLRRDTRTFDRNYTHHCWKYKIIYNGLTVYTRSAFCSHAAAVASLQRNWPRVVARLTMDQ